MYGSGRDATYRPGRGARGQHARVGVAIVRVVVAAALVVVLLFRRPALAASFCCGFFRGIVGHRGAALGRRAATTPGACRGCCCCGSCGGGSSSPCLGGGGTGGQLSCPPLLPLRCEPAALARCAVRGEGGEESRSRPCRCSSSSGILWAAGERAREAAAQLHVLRHDCLRREHHLLHGRPLLGVRGKGGCRGAAWGQPCTCGWPLLGRQRVAGSDLCLPRAGDLVAESLEGHGVFLRRRVGDAVGEE